MTNHKKTLKIIKQDSKINKKGGLNKASKTQKYLKIRKLGKTGSRKNPQQTRRTRKTRKTRKNMKLKQNIFKNKDFTSGDGMLTSVWGPSFWHVLHTISFNYPVEPTKADKKNYRDFVLQLKYVLPCKYCRINLRKNFKELPLYMKHMKSRDTFSRYIYDLHELINKMLGKKSGLSYEDVRQRYEHFRARCGKSINIENMLMTQEKKQTRKHKGCVQPLHKVKSKGVVNIVPVNTKCDSISVDAKCFDVNL